MTPLACFVLILTPGDGITQEVGSTPLIMATRTGQWLLVEALLALGADVKKLTVRE